jgi:hypothetical protein
VRINQSKQKGEVTMKNREATSLRKILVGPTGESQKKERKMKKQSKKAPKMMAELIDFITFEECLTEDDHGLGINKAVPLAVVEKLEWYIYSAANISAGLGMDWDHFNDLCDAAFDVAASRVPEETAVAQ